MNRTDLIRQLERTTDHGYFVVRDVVVATFAAIADELAAGGEVDVSGFGRFEVRVHAARTVSPQGRTVALPQRRIPKLVAARELKRRINQAGGSRHPPQADPDVEVDEPGPAPVAPAGRARTRPVAPTERPTRNPQPVIGPVVRQRPPARPGRREQDSGVPVSRSEIGRRVAKKLPGISEWQATRAIETMAAAISTELAAGGTVHLGGFGSFSTKVHAGYVGRSLGKRVVVPARRRVKFRCGVDLRGALNR